MSTHSHEVQAGDRFEFGENWRHFLATVTDKEIDLAVDSLRDMLAVESLVGKTFLDIGSGSGLFSLAAHRLGARVHSFDFDPSSVACTLEMRRRFGSSAATWTVEAGSVLDTDYMESLGRFDVVYSWGVLHHTGDMQTALARAAERVHTEGYLFIAIYNDQLWISHYWIGVKRAYNRMRWLRPALIGLHAPYLIGLRWLIRRASGRGALDRGMSLWFDMIDWLGGYPMQVARPEEIFDFFLEKGFALRKLRTCSGRMGCNEYVFRR